MLSECIFKKDGLYLKSYKNKEYILHKVNNFNELLMTFTLHCEMEDGIYIEDIFNCIKPYFTNLSDMFHIDLQKHYNYIRSDVEKSLDQSYIRIQKVADYETFTSKELQNSNTASNYVECILIHPNHEETEYSLSLSDINEWNRYPLKLEETMKIQEMVYGKDFDRSIKYGVYFMTVFEFFNGLFFELGFHGDPDNKDKFFKELQQQLVELNKNDYENCLTSDEVLERLNQKFNFKGQKD